MYVDDTTVTFAASDMLGLETQINTELKSINLWLRANKLSLFNVEGVKINQTDHSKALGLSIDENLSWTEHIHAVSKKVASSIGALKVAQNSFPHLDFDGLL